MFSLLKFIFLATSYASIRDCSNGFSQFKLAALDFTPVSPKSGDMTVMTVQFNNPGLPVTDGTVTTNVKYNFLPLEPSVDPLCSNTECPIVTGFNDRSTSNPWPNIAGSINTKIVWTDVSGNQLLCIQLDIFSPTYLRRSINNTRYALVKILNVFDGNGTHMCPANTYSKALVAYRSYL